MYVVFGLECFTIMETKTKNKLKRWYSIVYNFPSKIAAAKKNCLNEREKKAITLHFNLKMAAKFCDNLYIKMSEFIEPYYPKLDSDGPWAMITFEP